MMRRLERLLWTCSLVIGVVGYLAYVDSRSPATYVLCAGVARGRSL